jgi:hypothetical protein
MPMFNELSPIIPLSRSGGDFSRMLRKRAGLPVIALFAFVAGGVFPAWAHDAKSGWSYPFSCCSGYDCREVPDKAISERPEGYVINNTGEVVTYHDARIKNSPDGEFHWCSVAGANDSKTICLFVPPRSY